MDKKQGLTICIPSVIDFPRNILNANSIKKHLVDANKEILFDLIVNIDNFKYLLSSKAGNIEKISNVYKSIECKNCRVTLLKNKKRIGLAKSFENLLKISVPLKNKLIIFFDDDHILKNDIPLKTIFNLYQDSKENSFIFHLATCYEHCSSETPFIKNQTFFENEKIICLKNKKSFYTLPGTFLPLELCNYLLKNIDFAGNIEDVIGNSSEYKKYKVYTFFRKTDFIFDDANSNWKIPKACHFSIDGRRGIVKTASETGNYENINLFKNFLKYLRAFIKKIFNLILN